MSHGVGWLLVDLFESDPRSTVCDDLIVTCFDLLSVSSVSKKSVVLCVAWLCGSVVVLFCARALGLSCETQAGLGRATQQPENSNRAHLRVLALHNTQKREMDKKSAKFWATHPSGPTLHHDTQVQMDWPKLDWPKSVPSECDKLSLWRCLACEVLPPPSLPPEHPAR